VLGPDDKVGWPAGTPCDWQPELACIVGHAGRDLSEAEAARAIFGYLLVSAWSAPSSSETEPRRMVTALGPCVVTADEFDPSDLTLTARVNRGVWIREAIGDAPSRFARTVAAASVGRELRAGEVFSSPPIERGPMTPRRLTRDATVEVEAGPLGTLRNKLRFGRAGRTDGASR
jgi:2-keto-4-pentenoate hydratase/2-oxohepta-3-ene-1,7-dioic acid hydratase in catechol pathway